MKHPVFWVSGLMFGKTFGFGWFMMCLVCLGFAHVGS